MHTGQCLMPRSTGYHEFRDPSDWNTGFEHFRKAPYYAFDKLNEFMLFQVCFFRIAKLAREEISHTAQFQQTSNTSGNKTVLVHDRVAREFRPACVHPRGYDSHQV